MNNTSISVIIPVFNGEQYLAETIQSIFDQKHPSLEIIVVDDGSTDNTREVAKSFGEKIRYHKKENAGPASARNKGLELANGEFIAFLDADDIWVESKLSKQLALFEKHKGLGIAIGLTLRTKFLKVDELMQDERNTDAILYISLGAALIRKSVFDKIGLFDEELFLGEDTDWFNRAKESRISIAVHSDLVQYYRIHEKNITNDKRRSNFYIFKVLKKAKDRKSKPGFKPLPNLPKVKTLDDLIGYWHSADSNP